MTFCVNWYMEHQVTIERLMGKVVETEEFGGFEVFKQPCRVVDTLVQIGYEPLNPIPTYGWIYPMPYYLKLPNFFQYAALVHSVDGYSGLLRGLWTAIGEKVSRALVARAMSDPELHFYVSPRDVSFVKYLKLRAWNLATAICSIIVSHPFRMLTTRAIAELVLPAEERLGMFGLIKNIATTDGFFGFYAGVTPRLVKEVLFECVFSTVFCCTTVFIWFLQEDGNQNQSTILSIANAVVSQGVAATFTEGYTVTSTMMTVHGTSIPMGNEPYVEKFPNWIYCYQYLESRNFLNRHCWLPIPFYSRYYQGPTLLEGGRLNPINPHFGPFITLPTGSLYDYILRDFAPAKTINSAVK